MPIYEYHPIGSKSCKHCRGGFEMLQKLVDAPVAACPECGVGVRRIVSAPHVTKSDSTLDPDNLERHGFTQYRKSSKGRYRKTAGKGPSSISSD